MFSATELPPKPAKVPSPSKLTNILSTLRKSSSPIDPSLPHITCAVGSLQSGTVPAVVVNPGTPSPKLLPITTTPMSTSPASSISRMNISPRNEIVGDPATCEIEPGKQTTIEINRDKMGLG